MWAVQPYPEFEASRCLISLPVLPIPKPAIVFAAEEKHEIPKEAIREIIVNAVVHRDYRAQGDIMLFFWVAGEARFKYFVQVIHTESHNHKVCTIVRSLII
jgi:hypothetical protein